MECEECRQCIDTNGPWVAIKLPWCDENTGGMKEVNYHKSCYDLQITQGFLESVADKRESTPEQGLCNCSCSCHKGTIECTYCRERFCSFGVSNEPEVSPQEAKPTEEKWEWKCAECGQLPDELIRNDYTNECVCRSCNRRINLVYFTVPATEPPAESTEQSKPEKSIGACIICGKKLEGQQRIFCYSCVRIKPEQHNPSKIEPLNYDDIYKKYHHLNTQDYWAMVIQVVLDKQIELVKVVNKLIESQK